MNDLISAAYAMATYVYLDIETIPTQDPAVIDAMRKDVKAPAQFKKPESIAAWLAENGDAAAEESVAKTSFDGGLGHVCTVAWAFNDGDVICRHAATVADERGVISDLFSALQSYRSTIIVGHNVIGFDLPFLKKRAVVLGLQLPSPTNFPRDPKAWDKGVNDTMTMWGGRDMIGLDRLCGILDLPDKDGMDGSLVAKAWADGRHDEIAQYCAADVERTRAVHQRFLKAGW